MTDASEIAVDGKEYEFHDNGGDWVAAWYPGSAEPPGGKNHGSAGICIDPDRRVVLVSRDGNSWELPAGRPEGGEDWRATLDREMWEEACVKVNQALLLGFVRARCLTGSEQGRVLVRAMWRADVTVSPWNPEYEIPHRALIPTLDAMDKLEITATLWPIYRRWFSDAALL